MTPLRACPNPYALRQLAAGGLPEAAAEAIAQHVLTCLACAEQLNALQTTDPFVKEMQAAGANLPAADGAADALMERLVSAPPEDATVERLTPERPDGLTPTVYAGKTPATHASLAPVPRQLGNYEILAELGRGGMGVVYKARQIGLDRFVALKMLLAGAQADREGLTRFLNEAEAVARLRHANIVQVYDVSRQPQQPYFTMEFVEGGSLAEKLAGTPQPAPQAAALVEVLARAVHAAHDSGVIHRDLKPANVLLTADGTPKITDFGLAKRVQGNAGLTQSGVVMGTPSYMAPEQAHGKTREIGPAADVYALGAILYEMLTGRPPFRAESSMETLLQVIAVEPVPPAHLNPKVPRDLETICLTCLHKEKLKRYATAAALADDLRRFTGGEPIHARPAGPWERLCKWARRKPAAAALYGVSVLALLAVMASGALYAASVQRELYHVRQQEQARERNSKRLLDAQRFELDDNWSAARAELEKAQEDLDARPELHADELRDEVRQRLTVVKQKLEQQAQRLQAQKRLQEFQAHYDDAYFSQMPLKGWDAVQIQARTQAAARAALAVYGLDDQAGAADGVAALLQRDRPLHSPAEHARLAAASYELLLLWAQGEAETQPAAADGLSRQRADKALALLARAAALGKVYGLNARTYHLFKARFLAQSKGEALDLAAAEKAAPQHAVGRLDWFLTALDLYRRSQFAESIAACDHVLQEHHNDFWAHFFKAQCQLRLGQWTSAKAQLTVCLNLKDDFAWLRLLRGFAASEAGFVNSDNQLAAAEFNAAETDFDAALKQGDDLVQYVGLTNRGVLNIRRQRWQAAAADLRQAVKVYPTRFEAYVNLAQAYQGMNQWQEAARALDQAVARAPQRPVVYESRAKLHLVRKEWTAAQADFEQAVALEKGGTSARLLDNLVELGKLLHREGKQEAALASYNRALELKPHWALAQRFRAETLLALKRYREAGEALDDYLAVTRSASTAVYHSRALIHAQLGQYSGALEMYTLALRQTPADQALRCQRGWQYLLSDAVHLGLEDFQACLSQDERNLHALIGRGNARIRLKQLDGAVADAEAADLLATQQAAQATDRLLYNHARLYAQIAGHLQAQPRTGKPSTDQATAQRLATSRRKAIEYLVLALEKMPAEQRSAFWREQILFDPALAAARSGYLYLKLAAQYGGNAP